MRDEPIGGSEMIDIKKSLSQATASEIAVIDLKTEDAWWDTRLLVLLAGAARLGNPKVVVFVGSENGMPRHFRGWGYADELLHALIQTDPEYRQSLERARAEGRRWGLVEPPLEGSQDQEPSKPFPRMKGDEAAHETLADRYGVKASKTDLKTNF